MGSTWLRCMNVVLAGVVLAACGVAPTGKDFTTTVTTIVAATVPATLGTGLLSLGKPAYASNGSAARCNDGEFGQDFFSVGTGVDNRWSASAPAWCAIDLGAATATTVMVALSDEGAGADVKSSPGFRDYVVETSADSTNGGDGTWTQVVTVKGNAYKAREHTFALGGRRWVRVSISAPATATLDEIELLDVSASPAASIVWVGDSITARCGSRSGGYGAWPSLQSVLSAAHPSTWVMQIAAGTVGITSAGELAGSPSNLQTYLSMYPDVRFWGIAVGTNDSAANVPDAKFQANLQALVDAIKAAGHVPLIAQIPYTTDKGYGANTVRLNAVIERVTTLNGLTPGPDLYTTFREGADSFFDPVDGVHPNKRGCTAWQGAWAGVLGPLLER